MVASTSASRWMENKTLPAPPQVQFGIGREQIPQCSPAPHPPQRPPGVKARRIPFGKQEMGSSPPACCCPQAAQVARSGPWLVSKRVRLHHGFGGRQLVDGDYLKLVITCTPLVGARNYRSRPMRPRIRYGNLIMKNLCPYLRQSDGPLTARDSRGLPERRPGQQRCPEHTGCHPRAGRQ